MKYQPPFEPSFAGPVDGVYNSNPDAAYVNGNPATGQEGSIPPMEALAHPMRELVHLITYSGHEPSHEDLEQVRKAIKKMIEDGTTSNPTTGGAVALWEGLQAGTGYHKIRSLKAGTNVAIDLVEEPSGSGQYQVRISASGGAGEGSASLANIGDGAQVYKGYSAPNEELRTIKGVNGISVSQNDADITIDGAGLLGFARIYPEIETGDNKLVVTASIGEVVIAGDQTFIHRGARRIDTTATLPADRTFATVANKVYHLRWRWNSGAPVYVLCDLADAGYNSGAAADVNPLFDSTYDDVLIARVVTNGSNVPTVTTLRNKAALTFSGADSASSFGYVASGAISVLPTSNPRILFQYGVDTAAYVASQFALNWARTPSLTPATVVVGVSNSNHQPGAIEGHANRIWSKVVDRYGAVIKYSTDWAASYIIVGGNGQVVAAFAECELNAYA